MKHRTHTVDERRRREQTMYRQPMGDSRSFALHSFRFFAAMSVIALAGWLLS